MGALNVVVMLVSWYFLYDLGNEFDRLAGGGGGGLDIDTDNDMYDTEMMDFKTDSNGYIQNYKMVEKNDNDLKIENKLKTFEHIQSIILNDESDKDKDKN